jgi:putative membrane protein
MPVDVNPWAFSPHPEVWLLVGFLAVAYVYMVRVIGPKAVPVGTAPIERRHWIAFGLGMAVLWVASDWPLHDISEQYLYSAHMIQHMLLSYVMPPLALMATPTWLFRVLIGEGRLYGVVKFLTKPVVAGLLFNFCVMMLHLPLLVNASVESGPLHYLLHVVVVTSSLLMWMPVCGPLPELRMGTAGMMIYLFLQSVVPTVPAAWLTFAESPIYDAYNRPLRLWGLSVTDDQQLAGAIMKVVGGMYLWAIVIYLFFKRFAARSGDSYDYRRAGRIPAAEITGNDDDPLTTADVEREFARTVPPA